MKKWIKIAGRLIDFSTPQIMGIVNATPDSFYGQSRVNKSDEVKTRLEQMISAGADIIDVGGYSTRPGAAEVGIQEEINRVIPVIQEIKGISSSVIISIDTFRSEVAIAAVIAGAHMINDVSGGTLDRAMFATVSSLDVPYVLMHMRGNPQNMMQLTEYEDISRDVILDLQKKVSELKNLGVKDIIIDPGFGFAKTSQQGLELLNHLDIFRILEMPLLVGLSRKSMIWETLNTSPEEALNGTIVLQTKALLTGGNILRVHDVREAIELKNLLCSTL
jgi:dihydropteroate synthase